MYWKDEGYLLSKNSFNENSIIIETFTSMHGKYSGIVYGGSSSKQKKNFQVGNKILLNWKSKGENKPGYFSIELIKPKPGSKILEIGCGWGGFAEQIAKNYDVKLDCITISKKQYEYTKAKINKLGLNHKVNIQMLDYRDVKKEYDSIISIEMIEAVGEKYLYSYFKKIKDNLVLGGRAAIQSIVISDNLYDRYRKKEDFIQKYIFPGGFLPSLKSIKKLSSKSGLVFESNKLYGEHYSNTLQKWRKSFLSSSEQISRQGFNSSFKNMWDFYLSYCEAGFKSKNIDLIQFSLFNK